MLLIITAESPVGAWERYAAITFLACEIVLGLESCRTPTGGEAVASGSRAIGMLAGREAGLNEAYAADA